MERDFMGLNSKDTVVKEEALEGCKEQVFSISSGVPWPLSNGFEAFKNYQVAEFQSSNSLHFHHDIKQVVPVIMSTPFVRPHFGGVPVYPQLLGGVPVASPHLVFPSTGSFFDPTTEPWYGSKAVSTAAQLTIFYGGMVNVYDGISPEKAHAIMFLAGNGAFMAAANAPKLRAQAQGPTPMTPVGDAVSSPMCVSSHPVGQSTDNINEAAKTVMSSLGQAMQSAIPQARKASLARFLEKRKERVMASAPYYSLSKNAIDCTSNSNAVL